MDHLRFESRKGGALLQSRSVTYQLQGNRLIARADNGRQAMLAVEIVDAKRMKLDGELHIRE